MKTLERRGDGFSVVHYRAARTAWLACVPFGVLSVLPFFGESPLTSGRIVTAAFFACLTVGLFSWARPRKRPTTLSVQGSNLRLGDRTFEARSLALSGTREDWGSSAPLYRADALTPSGERVTLVEHPDPAVVLAQARELSQASDLVLEPGWGLSSQESSRSSPAAFEVRGEVRSSQRAAGATALGSALFVLLFFLRLVDLRFERGLMTVGLSLVLPVPAIAWGLLVGAGLLSLRATIEYSAERGLRYTQRCLGFVVRRAVVHSREIQNLHAVSPDGASPLHLVIESSRGVEAWPLVGDPAEEAVRQFAGTVTRADQPTNLTEPVEKIGVPGIIKSGHSVEG